MIKKGIYYHYKAPEKKYEVLGEGIDSETLEKVVLYKALYDSEFGEGVIWIRPLKNFLSTVEVDGKTIPRFTKIE